MLNLHDAARAAQSRIAQQMDDAKKSKNGPTNAARLTQLQQSFSDRLFDALRKHRKEPTGPIAAPHTLYLALPGFLLAKWSYLAFGDLRRSPESQRSPSPDLKLWKDWDALYATEAQIANFTDKHPRYVLLTHGLSPIDDSIFLLLDIGRGARVARAMGIPLQVMLADITWMSHNRSVESYGLTAAQIDNGLRLNLDRRQRLYRSLKIPYTIHGIVQHPSKTDIHEQKLDHIVRHYRDLVSLVWGKGLWEKADGLAKEDVSRLSRVLEGGGLDDTSPLAALRGFPDGLHSLEQALKPHLEIVRSIAKRFSALGDSIFSYYFAQYYAQSHHRKLCLKIAPYSELKFDEPFDQLDQCFRTWGDGSVHEYTKRAPLRKDRPLMTGVYLPQYELAGWQSLPYQPLSLDAARKAKGNLELVRKQTLLLQEEHDGLLDKVRGMLTATRDQSVIQLNRIAYDILAFVELMRDSGGVEILEQECARLNCTQDRLLESFGLLTSVETERESGDGVGGLWLSWIQAVGTEREQGYCPSHVRLACFTQSDWTSEALECLAKLIVVEKRAAVAATA